MKKHLGKALAFLLTVTIVFTSLAGSLSVKATDYVDTSGYESLAEIYKEYFKVGAACEAIDHWGDSRKEIGNPKKEYVIANLFNSITCGNELKPAYNFNSQSETLFKVDHAGEEMLQWAKDNGTNMRFHVLVWHSQVHPNFFAKDFKATSDGKATSSDSVELDEECLVDRDTLIDRLRTYIYGAMEYLYSHGYAETVYAMDVVNEAVDESKDDGLRRSYWYRIIGPEFLYYAFLFAREAEVKYSKEYAELYGLDPNGDLSSIQPKLFYNDYNEWFARRVDIIKDFVTNRPWNANQQMIKSDVINPDGDGTMKGDGLIDGIGMQGHLSDNNNINDYIKALNAYSEIVDEVHITELDVGCTHSGESRWYYQAKFYYDFFTALIEAKNNGAKLTSVTFWGLTDDQFRRFAISEIVKMKLIDKAEDVLDSHVERVKKAYPAYFDTYDSIDEVINYINEFDNLYCVGRNGQHRYNNIDHSMMTSFLTVDNILSGRKDKSNIWNVNTEKEYHESGNN